MRYIRVYEFSHEGGTKDYHLIQFVDDEDIQGRGLVIKRFGPVGKAGQIKMKTELMTGWEVEQQIELEKSRRFRRGYNLATCARLKDIDGFKRCGLQNLMWLNNARLMTAMIGWFDTPLTEDEKRISPKHFTPDETIDRGEVWGSW